MYSVLLSVHIIVTIALISIILLQKSASDSTGLSGSSNTSFMSGRAAASLLTRTTGALAFAFILTSLGLGILTTRGHATQSSIMDTIRSEKVSNTPLVPTPSNNPATPPAPNSLTTPAPAPAPAAPAKPTVPHPHE